MSLPDVIPLFPLPNVVLFPGIPLPLHIFEPRYREMVRDAVRGARLIGMVLLRGDWQEQYQGNPEIFGVGTVGEIGHLEELPDGRFNLVLRGLREFVIHRELSRQTYREAVVSWRPAIQGTLPDGERSSIASLVLRYLERLGRAPADGDLLESGVDDETFVNFLAQHLEVDPLEKQALLEASTLSERGRRLVDVLEFRLEELRSHPAGSTGRAH
ncbi:MAG TPA: LON peptidase substrate-binding domain-containing protein [Candidatus Binatia bacterium]|nr:LON peptidase substrate-binding domain-containing protein [Candidatus Binatia bacterium]